MENKAAGIRKGFRIAGNIFLLAVFLTVAYLLNNYFFTYPVIVSVLKGAALITMLAIAESIVLALGGLDLSIAGISLLSSTIVFYLVETGAAGVLPAALISLAAAGVIGLLNGVFIAKLGIQPVIVTLGTSLFVHGAAGAITNNISIFDTCPEFDVFKITISFIPLSLVIALIIMLLCYAVFRFTVAGRQIYAVGGSEKSAKLSGLNVDIIKIYTYAAAGLISGIGGLLVLADSTMSARLFGGGAELEIIFVAILGGVSLYSGSRIFFKTFVGAGVIAVMNRLIYGLFVFNYMRAIIIGLLFIIVLAIKKNMFKGEKTDD
jgi:ribose/xylose/arabinose/galactoside ABC-type transport system permease subunit